MSINLPETLGVVTSSPRLPEVRQGHTVEAACDLKSRFSDSRSSTRPTAGCSLVRSWPRNPWPQLEPGPPLCFPERSWPGACRCRTTLQQQLRTRGTSWGLRASGEMVANPRTAHLCTWHLRCQVSRGSSRSHRALGFRQAGTFGGGFMLLHHSSPSPEPLCLGLSSHGQVLKPWGSSPSRPQCQQFPGLD